MPMDTYAKSVKIRMKECASVCKHFTLSFAELWGRGMEEHRGNKWAPHPQLHFEWLFPFWVITPWLGKALLQTSGKLQGWPGRRE